MDIVTIGDFKLHNIWSVFDENRFVRDRTTDRVYRNVAHDDLQGKCGIIAAVTPIAFSGISAIIVASRVLSVAVRIGLFIPFRCVQIFFAACGDLVNLLAKNSYQQYVKETLFSIKQDAIDIGKDLLHIVATPLAILGAEFAAIYGAVANPLDGRKLYATIERCYFGDGVIAEEFQPVDLDGPLARPSTPPPPLVVDLQAGQNNRGAERFRPITPPPS